MKRALTIAILGVVLVAVSVAWWMDHLRAQERLTRELDREARIVRLIAAGDWMNRIYYHEDELDTKEFDRKRTMHLMANILGLYTHRKDAVTRKGRLKNGGAVTHIQKDAVVRETWESLRLLKITNTREFDEKLRNAEFVEDYTNRYYEKGELEPELVEFISRALKELESWEEKMQASEQSNQKQNTSTSPITGLGRGR